MRFELWVHKPLWNRSLSSGGCFANVSRALQDILLKFVYCRNRSSYENFKFQLEILTINVISSIVYSREIILESLRNISETTPRLFTPIVPHGIMKLNLQLIQAHEELKLFLTPNVHIICLVGRDSSLATGMLLPGIWHCLVPSNSMPATGAAGTMVPTSWNAIVTVDRGAEGKLR